MWICFKSISLRRRPMWGNICLYLNVPKGSYWKYTVLYISKAKHVWCLCSAQWALSMSLDLWRANAGSGFCWQETQWRVWRSRWFTASQSLIIRNRFLRCCTVVETRDTEAVVQRALVAEWIGGNELSGFVPQWVSLFECMHQRA